MSIKLGKREVEEVAVTPKIAEEWLAGNVANRDDRAPWVRSWAMAMERDEWLPTTEPIMFCDAWTDPNTGEKFGETLIDGQHRLQAVVMSGKTINFIVWRHCDPRERNVIGAGKSRTQADILKITRRDMKYPALTAGVASAFLRYSVGMKEAVDAWMVRRVLARIEPEIMLAVAYKQKLGGLVQRSFMAALVMALLIDKKATEPLLDLKAGTKFPYGDPARALREYLYEYIMETSKDMQDVYFLKVCNGIAAKLQAEPIKQLSVDPAGLAYLRKKAKPKLEPIVKDILGNVPDDFYTPSLQRRVPVAATR